jgi:hypothetical protein
MKSGMNVHDLPEGCEGFGGIRIEKIANTTPQLVMFSTYVY